MNQIKSYLGQIILLVILSPHRAAAEGGRAPPGLTAQRSSGPTAEQLLPLLELLTLQLLSNMWQLTQQCREGWISSLQPLTISDLSAVNRTHFETYKLWSLVHPRTDKSSHLYTLLVLGSRCNFLKNQGNTQNATGQNLTILQHGFTAPSVKAPSICTFTRFYNMAVISSRVHMQMLLLIYTFCGFVVSLCSLEKPVQEEPAVLLVVRQDLSPHHKELLL